MRLALPTLCALAAAALPLAASAQADLRSCRALADAAARLACYDALPLPGAAAAPAAAPAAAAVTVPVATPAPPAPAARDFGLENRSAAAETVESRIAGSFEGWEPRTRIRLANGQLWQVVDDSSGVYSLRDPKVSVRRTAFGGYVMEIEGAKRWPRVKRVE